MKFLLFSCLLAFAFAAPKDGETNGNKREIYSVEPVGDVVHDILHERWMPDPELLVGTRGIVRPEIMDDVLFRELIHDMPVIDREYLEFIERIHSGLPVIDRDVVPVESVLGHIRDTERMDVPVRDEVRFLWILDNLLTNPEWRQYLSLMDTDTGFLRDVERLNLETFIRDHSVLFEHYPFFTDIIRRFPRLLH